MLRRHDAVAGARDFVAFLAEPDSTAENRAAKFSPDLSLALVSTRAGFDALEQDWNALFARAGRSIHVFQGYNWNRHWADVYLATSPNIELAVVTGHRHGRLVLLWPLVVERTAGLRVLAWMGAPVSQYGDVIAEAGPSLLPALRDSWHFAVAATGADAVRLNKTRADSLVAPFLTELRSIVTQRQEAPYLDLASAPTWDAYEQRYAGSGRQKNRRRQLKRLEKQGEVEVTTWTSGPDAGGPAAQAVAMKRAWLETRCMASPAVSDDRFSKFFQTAAQSTQYPVDIRISALTSNGTTAAMEIAIRCRERLVVHVLAYDQAFEKCGPGNLLMEKLLARTHAEGTATYDLLAPGGGYKADWADQSVAVNDHAIGVTLFGMVFARTWLGLARPLIKRTIEGLPEGARCIVCRLLGNAGG